MLLMGIYANAQQMPLPDPNTPNVLFLKFSKTLNTIYAFGEVHVWNVDKTSLEWKDAYAFTSKDNEGWNIDVEFYAPDKEYFGYTELAPYNSVALTNAQLRDILSTKEFYNRDEYIDSFTKIYIIDLDSPDPRRPNKYKIIEVKHYYFSKNR